MTPGSYVVPGVALCGVVAALPTRRIENDEFADRWDSKSVADVTAVTGVEARFWAAPGQTAADLCQAAAQRLLLRLAWPKDSIDALLFVSQTPDQRMPATACLLHSRLGLGTHCQAFDVSLGCSGYAYGLWLAAALVAAGCRRVMLLAGDTISRLVDPHDRGTALLFGDAGSATAIERQPDAPPATFVLGTDGAGAAHLAIEGGGFRPPADEGGGFRPRADEGGGFRPRADGAPPTVTLAMNGSEVFGFTLRAVPALIRETLAAAGQTTADIDAFVLHQANRFILRHIARKLGVAPDRVPVNIERFGNTSSASIPLLLCTDLADRILSASSRLMLAGYGGGFSWGAALLRPAPLACAELVHA